MNTCCSQELETLKTLLTTKTKTVLTEKKEVREVVDRITFFYQKISGKRVYMGHFCLFSKYYLRSSELIFCYSGKIVRKMGYLKTLKVDVSRSQNPPTILLQRSIPMVTYLNVLSSSILRNLANLLSILNFAVQSVSIYDVEVNFCFGANKFALSLPCPLVLD